MIATKDTLAVICSGTGFTPLVIDFLHRERGLGNCDYDLLAIPGSIHSLKASSAKIKFFRAVVEYWMLFLVKHHSLTRVIIVDHENCAWFKELAEHDRHISQKLQHQAIKDAHDHCSSLFRPAGVTLELWHARARNCLVTFEKSE